MKIKNFSQTQLSLIASISQFGKSGVTEDVIDTWGKSSIGVANIRRSIKSLINKGALNSVQSRSSTRFVVPLSLRKVSNLNIPES